MTTIDNVQPELPHHTEATEENNYKTADNLNKSIISESTNTKNENSNISDNIVNATTNSNDGVATKERTDNNDIFSLHVKSEYILQCRPSSLGPLPVFTEQNNESAETGKLDDKAGNDKSRKNKRDRKNSNKRPRDDRIENADKVCLSITRGTVCKFGDQCRYNHDLSSFMKHQRPKDLPFSCHFYDEYGYCPYGVMCRFGASHLDLTTGKNYNKKDENNGEKYKSIPLTLNVLDKDTQIKLRKHKYSFDNKRHRDLVNNTNHEKNSNNKSPNGNAISAIIEEADKEVANGIMSNDDNKVNGEAAVNHKDVSLDPLPSKSKRTIDFNNKVYVAPLTTVGNLPFRRIMKKFGADITCGEMALASNLLQGNPSEWALLKRHPEEDVFGVQLAAGYPDLFTRVAEVIEKEECIHVDFVDINMGCPLDMICNKGAGASLMLREKRLQGALQGLTSILSCPVTIKMRTGWDTKTPTAHELVEKVSSWNIDGIGAIMVHGRSRLQRYAKQADWDYISQVAMSVHKANKKETDGDVNGSTMSNVPVIGNGDLYSYQDYVDAISHPGVAPCAMLARGALIKPWLPTEIKEKRVWDISATERFDILKDYVKFGLEHWGSDQQGVNNTRRFLLEWMSFLHRYVPVGLLEEGRAAPQMNHRPPTFMCGRNDLETLFLSDHSADWITVSERLLGPVPEGFRFEPKHKAKGYNK